MRSKKACACFLSAALCVFCLYSLSALDVPVRQIEDDGALRTELKEAYFTGSVQSALSQRTSVKTLPGGAEVRVRVERSSQDFTAALERRSGGAFSGWAQGSWALTRSLRTGEPRMIRIFLRSDPYTFIQLRPDERDAARTLLDAVVYDAFLTRGTPLPISFERALTASLAEIVSLAGARLPLRYFEPVPAYYSDTRTFVSQVRASIGSLQFADDGAIDEKGEYVFIATNNPQIESPGLNCSGFAKWLVDGLLQPWTGKKLTINELKAPFGDRGTGITAPWEASRDPFFGLDWTRNLAAAVQKMRFSEKTAPLADFEVQHSPFSQIIVRKGGESSIISYTDYIKDVGYASEGLHALLYTLAIDEPGNFYLAAVSDDRGGVRPRLRQFFHVAALVPYFDEGGVFRVIVFESAEETQFSRFKTRYPGGFINLVRIPLEGRFEP